MAALIGVCDLVLTPIEDHTGHESWSLPIAITNGIEDYKAAAWQEYWRRAWSACAPCVHGAAPTIPNPHADLRRSQSPCPHPHMPMCWRPILTCPCVGAPSPHAHVLAPDQSLWESSSISRPSPDHLPTISRRCTCRCRVEAFLAAAVPVEHEPTRIERFRGGIRTCKQAARRPHAIFGTKELVHDRPPLFIPSLVGATFLKWARDPSSLSPHTYAYSSMYVYIQMYVCTCISRRVAFLPVPT